MTSQTDLWAEAYRRGVLPPEKRALYEEAMRRGLVRGPERSFGRRLLDNLSDEYARSGAGRLERDTDPDQDGYGLRDIIGVPRLREGGGIDRLLDMTAGNDRRFLRSAGQTASERQEAIRRQRYEARAAGDPINSVGDGAAFLLGRIIGGAASAENWVAPGRTVVGRILGNAATAAGADVILQSDDITRDLAQQYSATQTGAAFVIGGTLGSAVEVGRPVSARVRAAFTDPVVPRATPDAPVPRPEGLADPQTSGSLSALTEASRPAPAPATPEFGIVQRVAPKTPLRDAISRAREGELPQMVGDAMARAYTGLVSDQHPLIRAVESLRSQTEAVTGSPVDLLPSQDPRMLARGRFDWAAIGHQDLLHGVHGYRELTPSSPALADTISAISVRAKRAGEKPEDALQRFNEYMVARRASLEWDRRARGELEADPVARSKDEADAFVRHIEAQDPEFKALADDVNAFAGALLKKALDGGLIDKATHDASIAGRDFYVPLRRVMEDGPKTGGKGGGNNASSEVKRFKGSERDVVDPVSVLVERAYRLNQRLRQNDLNLSFIALAERLDAARQAAGDVDAANGWLRRVEEPRTKVRVSKKELAEQASKPVDVDNIFEDGVEVWRPGEINDAGKAIIYAWRNGKREAWEVVDQDWGREVFEALAGMPKGMDDTFLNTVAAPTAVLSQTITRDPAFLFANFIRDQVSAWIITDVGFKPGEGALGIVDDLKADDLSRIYGVSGGISGGAATAMLGEAARKADVQALAQRGVKAKYFSSLGGLLQLSEISETGTRLRVFKRAFDRARKEGFSEYDSLIQASHTARDMIDFGRVGSKMHYTRRLVTFLNASLQGLDKTARVLGADGTLTRVPLKDALAPLFNRPAGPMRAEDAAALRLATKAWTKVAAISTFGLALSAMFHDDPEYQQANERTRATHWTIPWGDTLVKVPKPFELAFLSNVVERGFEATIGQEAQAWDRMWRGMWELFAPPADIPVAGVVGGLKSNTDYRTGQPIVPEHLQELPPELQYQHWNSQLSRRLGDLIGVAPAKIDYAIQGFGGPIGSYLLNGMDAADPDRPSGSWTDLPVVRRFVQPWARGSQDKRDFYDRAGGRTSELQRAKNGVEAYTERGNAAAANAILADLDEPGRIFVLSQLGAADTRRLNPLERARVVAQEGSALIGEMNGALPKDGGAVLPPLSRSARQAVEDAVERLVVSEMRNAMIATRQPGFENRAMMDRNGFWEDLQDIAPEVAAEMERRLGSGRNRAYDYEAVMTAWPQVESRLRSEGSVAYLDDLAADAQGRTPRWGENLGDDDSVQPEFRF